jgi:hypothetical protein
VVVKGSSTSGAASHSGQTYTGFSGLVAAVAFASVSGLASASGAFCPRSNACVAATKPSSTSFLCSCGGGMGVVRDRTIWSPFFALGGVSLTLVSLQITSQPIASASSMALWYWVGMALVVVAVLT